MIFYRDFVVKFAQKPSCRNKVFWNQIILTNADFADIIELQGGKTAFIQNFIIQSSDVFQFKVRIFFTVETKEKSCRLLPPRDAQTVLQGGLFLKKGKKYDKNFPKQLYLFFINSINESTPPSFSKFARSIGLTLCELEAFRKHSEFDRSWRDCIEIRRDYLTDCALTRRYDPSFVKFLLSAEFGVGEEKDEDDKEISVTITVEDS